jgi:hypothetical protein
LQAAAPAPVDNSWMYETQIQIDPVLGN